MAKRERTEEERAELRDRLARGRQTAAANRAAKAAAEGDETLLRSTPASADAAAARRQRLVGDLDADTAALFTDAELEQIEREEHAKAAAEKKKQALADVRATARQRARVDQDLISASVLRSEEEQRRLAEPVTFRMQVPSDGAGHIGRNGIRVDGRLFQDGQVYTEPRVVFESLLPNIYRAYLSELEFKTLDQQKRGGSAREVLARNMPQIEILHA